MSTSVLIYWHLEKTWSVQSINTIIEPKKEYGDVYRRGEIVKARFSGATYPGLVVQVSNNRESLKATAGLVGEIMSNHGPGDLLPEELLLALKLKEMTHTSTSDDVGKDVHRGKKKGREENTSTPKNKEDVQKKAKQKEKSVQKTNVDKRDAAKHKNEAALKMSEDIILKRRSCPVNPIDNNIGASSSWEDTNPNQHTVIPPIYDAYQSLLYDDDYEPVFDNLDCYHGSETLHTSTVPPATSDQDYNRACREIESLQAENRKLKEANSELLSENWRLKRERGFPGNIATPKKVKFLKELASFLSDSQSSTGSFDTDYHGLSTEMPPMPPMSRRPLLKDFTQELSESGSSCVATTNMPSSPCGPPTPKTSSVSITNKVLLLPHHQIYVSPRQMTYIKQKSTSPRSLLIVLLDTLFTKEILAASSAKGARQAVNKADKSASKPLDADTLAAIKEYVLKEFKGDGAKPVMTDAQMNEVINAKCGSARRALKQSV